MALIEDLGGSLAETGDPVEMGIGNGVLEVIRLDPGMAVFGENGKTAEAMIKKADIAMYEKKRGSKRGGRP